MKDKNMPSKPSFNECLLWKIRRTINWYVILKKVNYESPSTAIHPTTYRCNPSQNKTCSLLTGTENNRTQITTIVVQRIVIDRIVYDNYRNHRYLIANTPEVR